MTAARPSADAERLEELFERAAELPTAEHESFAARECGGDTALCRELLRLLAADTGDDHLRRLASATATAGAPRRGDRIGPYELGAKIGEGGMGAVYVAEQRTPIARRVALKLIKPGMDSARVVSRFEAERQALARMAHPNVAQVYDGGTTADGHPFFAMELVRGLPITEYCDRHQLTTEARLELFLTLCRGVQHAHQKGLIHRDLKPSNLLVTEQDGKATPKIIDFGVARAVGGALAERAVTLAGQIVGTLDYMSPEQADPAGADVDTRSDVYSLGVLLYQLTSGRLPFEHLGDGVPQSELQRAIRELDPPTPSTGVRTQAAHIAPLHGTDERTLVRELTGDLDWICMKALEKDPARRYQSVSELAADVRRHLAHEPVTAGRPGMLYRARKFARRHRALATAAAFCILGLGLGAYGLIAGRLAAEAKTKTVLSLSDNRRLDQLHARAVALWPPLPDRIPQLEAWLGEARALVARRSRHAAAALALGPVDSGTDEDRWLAGQTDELIARLQRLESEQLLADASIGTGGWNVARRLAVAEDLAAGFAPGGRYAEVWARELPAIRAAYPGLDIKMQVGLLPLGPDPDSGNRHWAFAHLLSGAPAEPDATGRFVLAAESGMVLLLLPGGTFHLGAQGKDENAPNYDPGSLPGTLEKANYEGPPIEVAVEPFLVSKYEMTQAQWQRTTGDNPSLEQPGMKLFHHPTNPVNQVTRDQCTEVLRRLGLSLPHERQWEYAARGGTTTPWWCDAQELVSAENLFGPADGSVTIAPVGAFRSNPFGLFDVHGNVSEWCANRPWRYGTDPAVVLSEVRLEQVARGGNSRFKAIDARSAVRLTSQGGTHPACGLRAVMALVF